MNRRALLLLGTAAAVIAAAVWGLSRVSRRIDERARAVEEVGEGGVAKRRDAGALSPTGIPFEEKFEWLRLEWPAEDARAALGGPIVLSARGNHVVFRRRRLDDPAWLRVVCSSRAEDSLRELVRASAKPEPGGCRFRATLREKGKPDVALLLDESDAVRCLETASAPAAAPFSPPSLRLRLRPADAPPSDATPWPAHPFPPAKEFLGDGRELRGPDPARERLLAALLKQPAVVDRTDGAGFVLVGWTVALP